MGIQKRAKTDDFGKEINAKTSKTVKQALKEILTTIVSSRSLTPESFVTLHLGGKQVPWPAMSARNRKIADDVVDKINKELNKIPTFSQSFEILAVFTDDANIRQKFVERIAYPHVMALIAYIDAKRRTLVRG